MGELLWLEQVGSGGGWGGGAIDAGLGLRMGVVCWDCGCVEAELCRVESMPPREEWSISSIGDSRVGVVIVDCEKRPSEDSAMSGTKALPALMVGKVLRRGREDAEARGGRRFCCPGLSGEGPQEESGEKKGEVGERMSGEKQPVMAFSEKQDVSEVTLSEWAVR